MTIPIPSEDRAKVDDALKDPDGPEVFLSLDIDGRQVGEFVFKGEWGADSSASGVISTDLTFSGRLPLSDDDAPSKLSVTVADVEIPQMIGHISLPEIEEDQASTNFIAASAGAEAGRVDLSDLAENGTIEFNGWTPQRIVRHVLRGLPYPSGQVRVDALQEPLLYFTRARQNNFWPEQFVSDVLAMVDKQTAYTLRDTADGGFVASPTLEGSTLTPANQTYNAKDFIKWRPPPRKERRYSYVVVFKRNDAGVDLFSYRATIPYKRLKHPPLPNTGFYISLDDESPQGPERARRLAYHMATNLSRGVFGDDSAILPYFSPRIEIQDVIRVDEEWEDMDGFWERSWLLWVDAYKHNWEALTTEISYTAALVEEEKLEAPAFVMPGVSGGVARLFWGEYGNYFYVDESVSWITDNGDYFTIDETSSGGVVTQSGDYFTVN